MINVEFSQVIYESVNVLLYDAYGRDEGDKVGAIIMFMKLLKNHHSESGFAHQLLDQVVNAGDTEHAEAVPEIDISNYIAALYQELAIIQSYDEPELVSRMIPVFHSIVVERLIKTDRWFLDDWK